MVVVGLAGCTGASGSTSSASGGTGSAVSILVVQNANEIPIKDMTWAQSLATTTGCQITWQSLDDTAWATQKNPSLAAGEVADITIRGIQSADAAQFPSLFVDLSKELDKLPNVQAFFKEQPEAEKLARTADGAIYSLPSSRGKAYDSTGQHMMINKTWLDKLGLPIPQTWDQLTATLEAFKTKDPNGNGKADEIPFSIGHIDSQWYSPLLLLNSTGIVTQFNKGPSFTGIDVTDGKVGNWYTSDQLKSVLSYYHELMADGLIPADALTADSSVTNANMSGADGVAKVGLAFGWAVDAFGDYRDQYVAMPGPAAPGVSQNDVVWDASNNEFETGKLAISTAAKDNPCVWKIANALYGEDYSVQQFGGAFGDYVTKDGDHAYTIKPEYQTALDNLKAPSLADRLAGWISDQVTIKGDQNAVLLRQVDDVYNDQRGRVDTTRGIMPDYVRLSTDDETTVANNNTAIQNYAYQTWSKWIMDGGIDAGWNDYVKQVKGLGLDQNVQVWQAAYDSQVKS